jgi:hypothetical protein
MCARRQGNELGNSTADEHSWTLMGLHQPNVAIPATPCQPPTGDQLLVAPGNMAGRFLPSVFISVHSRFPTEVTNPQEACHHKLGLTVDKPPTYERIEGSIGSEDTLPILGGCRHRGPIHPAGLPTPADKHAPPQEVFLIESVGSEDSRRVWPSRRFRLAEGAGCGWRAGTQHTPLLIVQDTNFRGICLIRRHPTDLVGSADLVSTCAPSGREMNSATAPLMNTHGH